MKQTAVTIETIEQASDRLNGVVKRTPLIFSKRLSNIYGANIYVKREDLQEVRSYKIRGAYSLMNLLTKEERKRGVVCASAGNHAQGVAYSASHLQIQATIFMPLITPKQKIERVKHFGGKWITIKLVGQSYDEASKAAKEYCKEQNAVFAHPFDDYRVINGQGTIAKEIYDELGEATDYVICPIGGGGVISGVSTYLKQKNPAIKIIGAQPLGSPSMHQALKSKKVVTLETIDTFVDGAAVKTAGEKTFYFVSKYVDDILLIPEGHVCMTMIDLYQNDGIVAEPAGALSIAALYMLADKIKDKTVVCILSGGNNDILRYPEIMEKSLVYQGLKHYFLISFAQKPGQLRKFVDKALSPTDDITRFEYIKKNAKETGPALVGIEVAKKEDYNKLLKRMDAIGLQYTIVTSTDPLYSYLI